MDPSSENNTPPSHERPAPLAYEPPRDRLDREPPVSPLAVVFSMGAGLVVSIGAMLVVGVAVLSLVSNSGPAGAHLIAGICMLVIPVIAFCIMRLAGKPDWDRYSRWMELGMLIGTALCLLVVGSCFAMQ